MSLAHGRPYLAIPGPSVMPDAVLRAMHVASPNIYEGDLPAMMAGIVPDLKRVARTDGQVAMYIANGHGAWEAALANTVGVGEEILVAVTGRFGYGWADMAEGQGIKAQILDHGRQSPIDPQRVADALRADTDRKIKAVLAVHVDTSSSSRSDIAALRQAIDAVGHPALLMVDCIASLACDVFEMDAWGVDVMVAGSQKGLMVPPGVSFVFFNARAADVRAAIARVPRYWDWQPRANAEFPYQYFGGTSPTHHLFGLRAALDMIHAEGIEAIWARHATLARAIWAACDVWGDGGPLSLNITAPAYRSHAVTALRLGAPYGSALRTWTDTEAGLVLGIGLGMSEPDDPDGTGFFRIGHMGHINPHMILGMLGTIEAGFIALKIPHGSGAVSAAAQVIAGG
ncbi:alanine--glyoxylate aminotransferase family protein [Puniceibacterium sp. IMCC21224]|uniref:pyridoxal-phosphate-dependent aminotransferase family protein n=1 Tax=Puniceibacterium sp. IMCC21224 TaxID=1618204 RepID=UPI00064DC958|nr:aminotransferase class V-fold PLP-dependent enzyme [Puniceibacterium sp. IMCC21224]KMK66129.1 serine-pyruvate aminotransferase/archaeal aspartate aminotransferase [Puniceibacterium sp. IMCC21224]